MTLPLIEDISLEFVVTLPSRVVILPSLVVALLLFVLMIASFVVTLPSMLEVLEFRLIISDLTATRSYVYWDIVSTESILSAKTFI